MSESASSGYSRQGSLRDEELEAEGPAQGRGSDFSRTLGRALSKFGRGNSCETTCSGSLAQRPSASQQPPSEVSHDGLSSQGCVSVHEASVLAGKTTVMVKNVPVKYTQRKLLREFLAAGFHGKMDFIYLPIDPRSRCSRGFAFCNFSSPEVTQEFFSTFHKKFLNSYEAELPLEVAAAEIQGFEANAEHYLVVKASRKEKGRDTFGCPTFLKPLPQQFLHHLREAPEDEEPPGAAEPPRAAPRQRAGLAPAPLAAPPGIAKAEVFQRPPPYFEPKAASRFGLHELPPALQAPHRAVPKGDLPGDRGRCVCANCHQTISANAFCPYCGSVNRLPAASGVTFIGQPFWI